MSWNIAVSGHDGDGNPEHDNLQKVVDAAVNEAKSQGLIPTSSVVNGTVMGVSIGPVTTPLESAADSGTAPISTDADATPPTEDATVTTPDPKVTSGGDTSDNASPEDPEPTQVEGKPIEPTE